MNKNDKDLENNIISSYSIFENNPCQELLKSPYLLTQQHLQWLFYRPCVVGYLFKKKKLSITDIKKIIKFNVDYYYERHKSKYGLFPAHLHDSYVVLIKCIYNYIQRHFK